MALIQRGSFDTFSARVDQNALLSHPALGAFHTLAAVREATRSVQPATLEFTVSSAARGLALKSLLLSKGFEGILQGLFNPEHKVYFLAWAWDLSGAPVVEYPGAAASAATCLIPLKVGQLREFMGAGIALFPARKITAGLAIRIMIWESDQDVRDFGKAMSEVASAVKASDLNNILSLVGAMAGATSATVNLVKNAAIELADVIGKILQANSDDYVDFYEGYYPAAEPWLPGDERHEGSASGITLTRFV